MIILIAGLPGSGKSYFAEKLAERLEAVYINSDQVRKAEQASGQYSFQDKFKVYKEMARLATHALKEQKAVIIDATFYQQSMRDLFFTLAKTLLVPTVFIEVFADEALIKERLNTPRKYSEADFKVYEKIKNEFEHITEPHLRLESTNENMGNMLNTAIQYIHNKHERK
jgi:predicted kinase